MTKMIEGMLLGSKIVMALCLLVWFVDLLVKDVLASVFVVLGFVGVAYYGKEKNDDDPCL